MPRKFCNLLQNVFVPRARPVFDSVQNIKGSIRDENDASVKANIPTCSLVFVAVVYNKTRLPLYKRANSTFPFNVISLNEIKQT